MKVRKQMVLALILMAVSITMARAEGLMMARSVKMFPEAMALLQSKISARGYKITRLQEVNENLARRNFNSDMYRVVFFGKYDEIKNLSAQYPELIPFLPLSITIFAEGDQTILVAAHPRELETFFPDPRLKSVFERWEKDITGIFDELRVVK